MSSRVTRWFACAGALALASYCLADGGEGLCKSDADCAKGSSCWVRIPRGPDAGLRGSEEEPGRCVEDEIVRSTY